MPGADATRSVRRGLAWALATAALVCSVLVGKSPISLSFWDRQTPYHYANLYVNRASAAEARRLRTLIPLTASVCATEFAATQFTHHRHVWTFPNRLDEADAVVFDRYDRWVRGAPDTVSAFQARVETSSQWRRLSDQHGIAAYRRVERQ